VLGGGGEGGPLPASPTARAETLDEREETRKFVEEALSDAEPGRTDAIAELLLAELMGVGVLQDCVRHDMGLADKLQVFQGLALRAGEKLALASAR
jgi:hypothetical protein